MADELIKLAQLRDAGVLSPDEFDQAKAKLLS
jgi:Short C-terminal domain